MSKHLFPTVSLHMNRWSHPDGSRELRLALKWLTCSFKGRIKIRDSSDITDITDGR